MHIFIIKYSLSSFYFAARAFGLCGRTEKGENKQDQFKPLTQNSVTKNALNCCFFKLKSLWNVYIILKKN